MQAIRLGPLLLPVAPLLLVLGWWAAQALAARLARGAVAGGPAPRPGPALLAAALAGLLAARLLFVLRWHAHYSVAGALFDLRDGGFVRWAGWLAAALVLALWGWRRPPLRRPLAGALAAAALVVLGGQLVLGALQPPPRPLPALVLRDLQDHPVALRSLRGQPLVLNLWATWCPPCRRELPMLLRRAAAVRGVRIVLAEQGDAPQQVRSLLRSLGLPQAPQVVLDSGRQLAAYYDVPGFPTTLFIRADGTLQRMYVGEMSAATLQQGIERLRGAR